MFDDAQTPSDTPDSDGGLPEDLERLERQRILNSSLSRTDAPANAELASALPGDVSISDADREFGDLAPEMHAISNAVVDIPRRPYRRPQALAAVAATLVVVLLLALVLTTFAHGQTKTIATTGNATASMTAVRASTATNVPTTPAAPTSTIVSGGGTNGTGGSGGATGTNGTGGTGVSTAPPGTAPTQVTGLSLTVDRTSVNGVCQDTNFFTFTLTISIAPGSVGGLVSFIVVPSDSMIQQISSSLLFGSIDTSETTTFGENIQAEYGDGTAHWVQVQTTSPNVVSSQKVSFEANCIRQVTSVTATVTPSVWNAPCSRTQTFTFTFVITLTPGPIIAVTFNHDRTSGFAEWEPPTVTINPVSNNVITYTVPGTLYSPTAGGSNGTYWQSITVTSPATVASNQAMITEAC